MPHVGRSPIIVSASSGLRPSTLPGDANLVLRTRRPVMRFLPSPGSSSAHETSPLPVHTSVGGCRAGDDGGWPEEELEVKGDWRELRRYVSRGSRMYKDRSVVEAEHGCSSGLPLGREEMQRSRTREETGGAGLTSP